jgi:hypothetical protein
VWAVSIDARRTTARLGSPLRAQLALDLIHELQVQLRSRRRNPTTSSRYRARPATA